MDPHQTPAQRLTHLGRCRSLLARSESDIAALNRRLAVPMAQFELAKLAAGRETASLRAEAIISALTRALEWAEGQSPLDVKILRRVHAPLDPEAGNGWRKTLSPALCDNHEPLPEAMIPRALERLFEWLESPGFLELHPVEQMTLCQVRTLEISPFERHSACSAALVANCWMARAGFLLPYFDAHQAERFWSSLSRAFSFSTGELVEFNLDACLAAYHEIGRVQLG